MTTATTTYNVTRYNDGQVIGQVELTDEQYAAYDAAAQQSEGLISAGDLTDIAVVDLKCDPATTVYLD